MANSGMTYLNQTILEKEAQRSLFVENNALSVAKVGFVVHDHLRLAKHEWIAGERRVSLLLQFQNTFLVFR